MAPEREGRQLAEPRHQHSARRDDKQVARRGASLVAPSCAVTCRRPLTHTRTNRKLIRNNASAAVHRSLITARRTGGETATTLPHHSPSSASINSSRPIHNQSPRRLPDRPQLIVERRQIVFGTCRRAVADANKSRFGKLTRGARIKGFQSSLSR